METLTTNLTFHILAVQVSTKMKVQKIAIVGGGTSGWLTAAYLTNNLNNPAEITVIESTKIGPIGVGEGTQPYTTTFLRACGLSPREWMPLADATYKLGVEFVGWHDKPFFVDNDSIKTHQVKTNLMTHQAWVGKDPADYFSWLPTYRLAKNNVSPKLSEDLDFVVGSDSVPAEAVHFNAFKIGEALRSLIKDKTTYYDSEVIKVEQDSNGITKLILDNNVEVSADLYIDCTGFKSLLIEQTLGSTHSKVDVLLPCDNAVTIPTQYKNPKDECHPYTKSTAMSAGWRWTIPTFNRIGNGYVYSSKFISKEEAEKELREAIGDFTTPATHLAMKCGYKQEIAIKNVVAVGLSAGFVEPLEATGITFTTKTVEMLCHYLNTFEGSLTVNVRQSLNTYFVDMIQEIVAFIFLHYKTSSKRDTKFWESFEEASLPFWIRESALQFVPTPPTDLRRPRKYDMFHSGQWFQMFNACGQYANLSRDTSQEELEYINIYNKMLECRTDLEIEKFPNHYQFLKDWYSKLGQ